MILEGPLHILGLKRSVCRKKIEPSDITFRQKQVVLAKGNDLKYSFSIELKNRKATANNFLIFHKRKKKVNEKMSENKIYFK